MAHGVQGQHDDAPDSKNSKSLVAARDRDEQRTGFGEGRIQLIECHTYRTLSQTLGGEQPEAKRFSLRIRDVDAEFLYQPCRPRTDGEAKTYSDKGKVRVTAVVRKAGIVSRQVFRAIS